MTDSQRLRTALIHLQSARSQFVPADDEIIRDHVETAIFLLEGVTGYVGREPGPRSTLRRRIENDVEEGARR